MCTTETKHWWPRVRRPWRKWSTSSTTRYWRLPKKTTIVTYVKEEQRGDSRMTDNVVEHADQTKRKLNKSDLRPTLTVVGNVSKSNTKSRRTERAAAVPWPFEDLKREKQPGGGAPCRISATPYVEPNNV